MGMLSGILGGAATGGLTSLLNKGMDWAFGGSSSPTDMGSNQYRNLIESQDKAGSMPITSQGNLKSIDQSNNDNKQGHLAKIGGQFMNSMSTRLVNEGVNKIFSPKEKSPLRRGLDDRAYTSARYPGVNPWELSGAGGAGGAGQGGQAVPAAERENRRLIQGQEASSAKRVADIHNEPALKKITYDYDPKGIVAAQKGQIHAQTRGTDATTTGTLQQNQWRPTLNNIKANLERAKTFLTGTQDIKSQTEVKKIEAETKRQFQQLITDIQQSGIATHDKTIKANLARVSNILAGTNTRAYLTIAGGAATALLRSLPSGFIGRALGMGKGGNFKGGKVTNWPKYGPKAGQTQ